MINRETGAANNNEETVAFRKKFYKISAWLGLYFPIRLLTQALETLYPRPFSTLTLECVILAIYLMYATLSNLEIDKRHLRDK